MIEIPIPVRADLDKGIKKKYLDTIFVTEDNKAHRFDVAMYRGNEALELPSGATVSAYFIRYCDNGTLALTGSVSGNVASVTMSKACYSKGGAFALIIKVLAGEEVTTVFYGEGSMFVSRTDTVIDTENVIPSLDDLLAQIAVMEQATADASMATEGAYNAADNAAGAADRANTAADKIDGMTVSAVDGTTAKATITEVNGVKHITFTLQKGVDGTSFIVKGMYATLSALQAAHATGATGDAYAVGTSKSNDIYIWDADAYSWVNMGALQGPAGQDGNDGYSPVKGKDYWTEADKTEIVNDVLAALPNASGVNF